LGIGQITKGRLRTYTRRTTFFLFLAKIFLTFDFFVNIFYNALSHF